MKAIEIEELLSGQNKELPGFKLEECLQVSTDTWYKLNNAFADPRDEKVIKLYESDNYAYYLRVFGSGDKQMWRNKI